VLTSLYLLAGCGQAPDIRPQSPGEAPRSPDGPGSATVAYKSTVHVIEQAEGTKAMVRVSTDGSMRF